MPLRVLKILHVSLSVKLMAVFLGFAMILTPVACGENCGVIDDLCSTVEHSVEMAGHDDAEAGDIEQLANSCIGCHIQVHSQDYLAPPVKPLPSVIRFAAATKSDDPAPHNYLRPPRI